MVRGELSGNPDQLVTGLAGLREATPSDVSFLASPRYQAAVKATHAGAVIVARDLKVDFDRVLIRVDNPSEAFGDLVRQVAPPPVTFPPGVHPTAVVASTVRLGKDVSIQPHAVIEDRAVIGDRTIIGAGNLASTMASAASAAYSHNVCALVAHLAKDGAVVIDLADEIQAGVVISFEGKVVNPATAELVGSGASEPLVNGA